MMSEGIDNTFQEWSLMIENELKAVIISKNMVLLSDLHSKILTKIFEESIDMNKLKCFEMLEIIHETDSSLDIPGFLIFELTAIGMSAYQSKELSIAEKAFRIAADNDSEEGKNNYAYMLRRSECKIFDGSCALKALRLLYPIAKKGDAFATVNLVLTFALCFGEETDWVLADKLMKNITQYNIDSIVQWWKDVAAQGDIEGDLVHYFLLRHNKIDESDLGSLKSLSRRIRKNIPGIPEWLCEDSDFDSLDDVFDAFDDVDFFELLDEYLNNMPRNRNSVDEILEKIEIFDILDLYQTVLDYDFRTLLTNEEIHKLVKDYKEKFSAELPFDIDEI